MNDKHLPFWIYYLGIALIAVLTHILYLTPASFFMHTADTWIYSFVAIDGAVNSKLQLFPYELSYGGLGLTLLRIIATKVASWITANPDVIWQRVQIIFSYTATPVLVAWSLFFYLSRVVSKQTAIVVGGWAAVGFNYLIHLYGLDPFPTMICSLFLLLGIRGQLKRPLQELSLAQLFGSGLLLGFSSYVHRGSLLAAPAFLISVPWIHDILARLRTPDRFNKIILGLCLFFISLSLYSNWLGREIATIAGRTISVDPHPNVRIALILFSVFLIREYYQLIVPYMAFPLRRRWSLFGAAVLVGLLPEFFSALITGKGFFKPFPPTGQTSWGHVARALDQLLAGPTHWQSGVALGMKITGIIFLLAGLGAGLRRWREKAFVWPVLLLFLMNLYVFFRVRNSTEGDPRYILTFFPLFVLSVALCWEQARGKRLVRIGLSLCLLISMTLQVQQRFAWHEKVADPQAYSNDLLLAQHASEKGYRYVWAQNYWIAGPLSILTRCQPIFVSDSYLRIPWVSNEQLQSASRVGAYFQGRETPLPATLSAFGQQWNVVAGEVVGNGVLAELAPKR